jgi:CRISPR type III-B/RAMP module-associated protein Cmr5
MTEVQEEKDYKLAIEAFNLVYNALDKKAREGFRSRARDMVEEIYTSGFIPTFLYIISKAGLEDRDKMDSFITLVCSTINGRAFGKIKGQEDASYAAYLFVILFYLIKENILGNELFKNLRSENFLIELINELYEKAPIISARLRTYLVAIKRLTEALIEAR